MKKRIVLKPIVKFAFFGFLTLFLIVLTFILLKINKDFQNEHASKIDYSLSGDVDYNVKLKPNEYYNTDSLKSGMQYIASLIKSINVKFNYELHSSDYLDYNYKYRISAKTIVNEKLDKNKILFETEDILVDNRNITGKNNNFLINEDVIIDYDKYNNYIIKYKKEYSLNADINLVINMHVDAVGQSNSVNDDLNRSDDLQIIIPLSEHTLNISMTSNKIKESGTLFGNSQITKKHKVIYYAKIVMIGLAVISFLKTLSVIIFTNNKKDPYTTLLKKYLKEYDRAIVTTNKLYIDQSKVDQIINVTSMVEMIDLHDNLQLPILFYEEIKGQKAYFLIIKENNLYRLILSRAMFEINDKK